MTAFLDATGMRFGRLVVLKYGGKSNAGLSTWICQCDCGNTTEPIQIGNLTNGHTQSCGCYLADRNFEIRKKYNAYDLSGKFGVGYTFKGEEFYFDLEDYDLIKNYCWSLKPDGAVVCDHLKMHRLVLGILDNPEIRPDHKNRNRQDNRKENLRPATFSQNAANRSLQPNNTTGIVGVYKAKSKGYPDYKKWKAKIENEKIVYELGTFETFDEAVVARLTAEKEIFGEFAPQKHLYEQYNII